MSSSDPPTPPYTDPCITSTKDGAERSWIIFSSCPRMSVAWTGSDSLRDVLTYGTHPGSDSAGMPITEMSHFRSVRFRVSSFSLP
jgi:hypothetical protein